MVAVRLPSVGVIVYDPALTAPTAVPENAGAPLTTALVSPLTNPVIVAVNGVKAAPRRAEVVQITLERAR